MRQVMADAEVGDEQKGEDPTVRALLQSCSALLAKEEALFLPSGTMCNLVALKTHTQPGQSVLLDSLSHILRSESGGAALVSGVLLESIATDPYGHYRAQDLERAAFRKPGNAPKPVLVCLEQTHNLGGGSVWPLDQIQEVTDAARSLQLKIHIDGARLFNASIATATPVQDYARVADSIWIDFSKGLGAPFGAVLLGSREFIHQAKTYKHLLGGAMRQAGIMAAAAHYALENNVPKLRRDHEMAAQLAAGLREIPGIAVMDRIDTNMVYFSCHSHDMKPTQERFLAEMTRLGVRFSNTGERLRAVTHLDIRPQDIAQTLEKAKAVCTSLYYIER